MRTRALVGIALLLPVILAAGPARAERVAVMSLRQAPGTLSDVVLHEANKIIWQRVSALPGVIPVAEGQIAAQLQTSYASFAGCYQDACMQQLGYLAGAEKVVWGYVQKTQGNGFGFQLRTLSIATPQALATVNGGCTGCMDAELLGQLMALDLTQLALGGGATVAGGGLPPAQQPQSPPPPPQPPVQPPPPAAPPVAAPPASVQGPAATGSATGLLSITSKPTGAAIFVGNRQVGVTPMKQVELYPGTHNFLLQLEGYQPSPLAAQVLPGKHNKVEVKLRATHGSISIRSTPPGAFVSVNGQPVGKTPMNDVKVALGTYDLAVVLEGYHPERKQVVLDGSQPEELHFQLKALPPTEGTLVLTTRPAGAAITVDGRPVGNTPLKLTLPGGKAELVATLAGYDPLSRTIEITAGKTDKLNLTLQKEPPREGDLKLLSQPKGAQVFLDNQPVGVTPTDLKAERGTHLLRWELDGYTPSVQTVEVIGGKKVVLNAKLTKAPPPPGTGALEITVEPKKAVVTIGGRDFPPGNVPPQVLMVGTYPVLIKADGYQPLEFQVEVQDQKELKLHKGLLRLPPPPPPGLLTVNSTPKGAHVQANGVDIGTTPIRSYKLDPGFYTIGIYLDGHASHEQEVEVVSRRTLTIDQTLKSLYATLKVTTKPKGATVFLQDQEMGTTPGTFTNLKGGTYKLLVSKEGCKEMLGEVTLTEGEVTKVHYDIEEAPGSLTLHAQPPQAIISIDGKEIGKSPLRKHSLAAGVHEVVARLEGYKDAVGKVTIEKGKEKMISFTLEELPKLEPPKPPAEPAESAQGSDAEEDAGHQQGEAAAPTAPAATEQQPPAAPAPPAEEKAAAPAPPAEEKAEAPADAAPAWAAPAAEDAPAAAADPAAADPAAADPAAADPAE